MNKADLLKVVQTIAKQFNVPEVAVLKVMLEKAKNEKKCL